VSARATGASGVGRQQRTAISIDSPSTFAQPERRVADALGLGGGEFGGAPRAILPR